ncbi:hypothetical protein SESBI_31839 [Sesbania bispinosa]|nr:hypothetical protein SESBI_31839 [Sesbania bispinosa]
MAKPEYRACKRCVEFQMLLRNWKLHVNRRKVRVSSFFTLRNNNKIYEILVATGNFNPPTFMPLRMAGFL